MSWLSSNWIWVLLIGGMLWMHLGMNHGHGGHGGHETNAHQPQALHEDHDQDASAAETAEAGTGSSHRHRGC